MHYIYCVTNTINGKIYVGQTVNFNKRKSTHLHISKRQGKFQKYPIHNAIKKYGEENFIWKILETVETLDEANKLEEAFILELNSLYPNGYNLLPGGENRTPSEISRIKLSETHKKLGTKPPSRKGIPLSQISREKLSKTISGDGSSGKKINSKIAAQIYKEYIDNTNDISFTILAYKYNLDKCTISDLLHKKTWKEATKHFPNIDFKKNSTTNSRKLGIITLTINQVKNIKNEYLVWILSDIKFIKLQMKNYGVSRDTVYKIIKNITYKDI